MFDNSSKKYHASFLIRGYRAIVPGEDDWENNDKNRNCAPHDFWYDFFGGANMLNTGKFSIEWIDEKEDTTDIVKQVQRININDGRLWGFKRTMKP